MYGIFRHAKGHLHHDGCQPCRYIGNLVTKDKVISYANRALTAVKKRYSQAEKEALAIVRGAEHFHLYLYGTEFTLITDHKPLDVIYGNKNAKSSARIERWVLRLQPYLFKVVYRPGVTNPAACFSRHPIQIVVDKRT